MNTNVIQQGNQCFNKHKEQINKKIHQSQIESIDNNCFPGCSRLQSIEIPQSVKELPFCCFLMLFIFSTITIGEQIESIGNWCFP
jgi:hypothetical protein